jgi:hypothetical protein
MKIAEQARHPYYTLLLTLTEEDLTRLFASVLEEKMNILAKVQYHRVSFFPVVGNWDPLTCRRVCYPLLWLGEPSSEEGTDTVVF